MPTLAPPASLNLTDNREGGNDQLNLLFDAQGSDPGRLHLVWPAFGGSGLYYRVWTPAEGWSETAQIGPRGCPARLAVNAEGLARVAIGCWDGVFFFQQLPGGDWLPPYQVSDQGGMLDLAVDEGDTAHIVYLAENDIHYVTVQAGVSSP